MKKLISLIVAEALAITGCATMQEPSNLSYQKKVFSNLGVSEKFVGYENKLLRRQLVDLDGMLYELKDYDTNGDRKRDVRETFELFGRNPNIPSSYMFDLNFDGEFDDDEIWIDYLEDGLNGNEKRCDLEILNANGEKI